VNLQAFRLRVLGGALLGALVALITLWTAVTGVMGNVRLHGQGALPETLATACAAEPAAWAHVEIGESMLRAYRADGTPAWPGDPPLPSDVDWRGLTVGQHVVARVDPRRIAITRTGEAGDCAILALEQGPPPAIDVWFRSAVSLGLFLGLLGVGGLTYLGTVSPLLRRIERLRAAAVGVGAPGYARADDGVGDALAEIGASLDRSHARIEADRTELVARHEGLERHLAEIAHDLRTPLGSLLLAVQEVRADADGPAARRAVADAAYVGALVENLHQAARIRFGLDPREGTTDLRDLVLRLEVRFRALGDAAGVSVAAAVPDGPIGVRCTPVLLERALANLLQNALEHGASHVAVLLERTGTGTAGGFRLTIRDDGPGVPAPADLALRTFTDRADRPRGPGLGLAITNEVAARAGFTIDYSVRGGLVVVLAGPTAR
jgi:signal transduction histidine kinase